MKESERLLELIHKDNRFFLLSNFMKNSYIFDCWNCNIYMLPEQIKINENNKLYFEKEDTEAVIFLFDITDKLIDFSQLTVFDNKFEMYTNRLEILQNEEFQNFASNKLFFGTTKNEKYKYYFYRIFNKKITLNSNSNCSNCKWKYLCINTKKESCANIENNFKNTLKSLIYISQQNNKDIIFKKIRNELFE